MVTRPHPQIILGATHDAARVTTPGDAVTLNTAKIYQGSQGIFTDEGGTQAAHLTATAGQCNPSSNFTLTVNYNPPGNTREISKVTAKGFGNTSVSNWFKWFRHPEEQAITE
jgi:hypothetical protein